MLIRPKVRKLLTLSIWALYLSLYSFSANFIKQTQFVYFNVFLKKNPFFIALNLFDCLSSSPALYIAVLWTVRPCFSNTVCPGSSDPPEKMFNIFASENEVYTIY